MHSIQDRRPDQGQQLVDWRRQYLAGVGVDPELASTVAADLRWDLNALVRLLERGCSEQLAARILAPVDEGPSR